MCLAEQSYGNGLRAKSYSEPSIVEAGIRDDLPESADPIDDAILPMEIRLVPESRSTRYFSCQSCIPVEIIVQSTTV